MLYFILSVFIVVSGLIILYFSKSLGIPAKLQEAEQKIEGGEPQNAAEILKKVLSVETGHPKARYLLGMAYMASQQNILAANEFKKLLNSSDWKKHFKETDIRYKLAEIYHNLKDYSREIAEYQNIQQVDPEDFYANKKLGLVYFEKKDYENAFNSLKHIMEQHGDEYETLVPYAISAYEQGALEQAKTSLEKIININPAESQAHYYLGRIFQKEEKYPKAIEHLEQATEDAGLKDKAWYQIGKIHLEQAKIDDAISTLQNITFSEDRDILDAYYDLSYCYEQKGQINNSIKIWQRINDADKNYRNVLEKIEQYHDIAQSPELVWFFSLDGESTKEFLRLMFTRLGLYVGKIEGMKGHFKLIAFRNQRKLDMPILIEVHKSTKPLSEVTMHDFIKNMEKEKSSEGYLVGTTQATDRTYGLVEGRQIQIIQGSDLTQYIKELKDEFLEHHHQKDDISVL